MTKKKEPDGFDLASGIPSIEGAIRPLPKFADRISKRVLGVLFLFVFIMVVIFLVSLNNMDNKPAPKNTDDKDVNKESTVQETGIPKDILGISPGSEGNEPLASNLTAKMDRPSVQSIPSPSATGKGGVPSIEMGTQPLSGVGQEQISMQTQEQQFAEALRQASDAVKVARMTRMQSARSDGLSGRVFDASGQVYPTSTVAAGVNISDMLGDALKATAAQEQPAKAPDGEQDSKLAFLQNASKESRNYHPNVPLPAMSINEVKTGTYIPMSLEQNIVSDLPGQITARVTEAVYDTISGCRLLIPPLSKAVGRYDSKIALGQGRMLIVWNSLIFPDGSELNLAGMQGYDMAGQSGLKSDVDNHYWRLFGLTFGMSMITAGVQLSVPQPNPTPDGASAPQTPSQIIAASLAQQYGQLGAQLIGKYMAVQPTLRNYAGERFMIMVPHTMVFNKVWRNRCIK